LGGKGDMLGQVPFNREALMLVAPLRPGNGCRAQGSPFPFGFPSWASLTANRSPGWPRKDWWHDASSRSSVCGAAHAFNEKLPVAASLLTKPIVAVSDWVRAIDARTTSGRSVPPREVICEATGMPLEQVPGKVAWSSYRKDLITNASVWHRLRPTTTHIDSGARSRLMADEGSFMPVDRDLGKTDPAGLQRRRQLCRFGILDSQAAPPEECGCLWILPAG